MFDEKLPTTIKGIVIQDNTRINNLVVIVSIESKKAFVNLFSQLKTFIIVHYSLSADLQF